jgi:hypothetical protein
LEKKEVSVIAKRMIAREKSPKCALCQSPHDLEGHHLKPKQKGGADVPENIVVLCKKCHAKVHGKQTPRRQGMFEETKSAVACFYLGTPYKGVWQDFRRICSTEGTSASNKLTDYIVDYVRLHEPGNPQQRIDIISQLEKPYRSHGCLDCGNKKVMVETRVNGITVRLCDEHFKKRKHKLQGWRRLEKTS